MNSYTIDVYDNGTVIQGISEADKANEEGIFPDLGAAMMYLSTVDDLEKGVKLDITRQDGEVPTCNYCGSAHCTEKEPACDEAQAGGFQ
jgi:hypothetical protein